MTPWKELRGPGGRGTPLRSMQERVEGALEEAAIVHLEKRPDGEGFSQPAQKK